MTKDRNPIPTRSWLTFGQKASNLLLLFLTINLSSYSDFREIKPLDNKSLTTVKYGVLTSTVFSRLV